MQTSNKPAPFAMSLLAAVYEAYEAQQEPGKATSAEAFYAFATQWLSERYVVQTFPLDEGNLGLVLHSQLGHYPVRCALLREVAGDFATGGIEPGPTYPI